MALDRRPTRWVGVDCSTPACLRAYVLRAILQGAICLTKKAGTHSQVPDLQGRLLAMTIGQWVSQSVYALAELGIPDLLKNGARSAAEIAASLNTNEDATYRLIRALAGEGVFIESPDRKFALTELGALLRSDVPGTLRGWARFVGCEERWKACGEILFSIRTGRNAMEKVHWMTTFALSAQRPEVSARLNDAMTSISTLEAIAVSAAADLRGVDKIVDVGGGHGFLLVSLLRANPAIREVVYEMQHAIVGAKKLLAEQGVSSRGEAICGDFFESVPVGANAYVIKHIIHDWDDERSITILRNCKTAMTPGGRLMVVENVLAGPNEPDIGKFATLRC
jgi:C-methyltransferase